MKLSVFKLNTFLAVLLISNLSLSQNALDFDGTNDHVQTTKGSITGNTAKTIEAWIKTTANANPSAGGKQNVIVDMGTGATGSRFTLCILWANAIRLEVAGSGLSGTIAVNDGNWHHVAGVYDPLATNKFSLYVDGVLDVAGNIATTVNTSSGNIRVGRRIDNVNYFDGSIDEVRIWNVARSASQIANDRNTEYCAIPSGLVAYYNFNQNVAGGNNSGKTTLFDAVAGKNGTLNGFSLSGTSSNWVSGASLTPGLSVNNYGATVCDSMVSPSGNQVWTTTGKYTDTLLNANNCDSLINVNLQVNNSFYSVVYDTTCEAYTSPSTKYTYESSGIYFDTTTTPQGCPYIHELNLDITIIDTTVSQSSHVLTSNQANAFHYLWLDCNDNFNQISGTNSQVYTPSKDGNYAVRVTVNQCIDTSECVQVIGVGINDISEMEYVTVFPNPVKDVMEVQISEQITNIEIEIVSVSGEVVHSRQVHKNNDLMIDVNSYTQGMYFLKIQSLKGESIIKFIKE